MQSITSREEVIQFLKEHNTPLLQCEFMMHIAPIQDVKDNLDQGVVDAEGNTYHASNFRKLLGVTSSDIETPDEVLLTQFDCPDAGIKWMAQQDKFGFVKANLNYAQLNVSFISPIEQSSFSPIHKYYNNQFTEDGLIKADNNSFADIKIFALVEGTSHLLFRCSGCRFSYPIPLINLSTPKISVFKTIISYNSFRYGI